MDNLGDIFEAIWLTTDVWTRDVLNYTNSKPEPAYPYTRFKIDLHRWGKFNIKGIQFWLKNGVDIGIEVQLEDKMHSVFRTLYDNAILQKGDGLGNSTLGHFFDYSIVIHQEIFVEKDKTKKCQNYPNIQ